MRSCAKILISAVLLLIGIGLVVLASTGSVRGDTIFGDPYYFIKRQGVWLVAALAVGAVLTRFDYRYWQKLAIPVYLGGVLLLLLTLFVGVTVKGSTRWLAMGPFSLQPSELAKFSTIVALCAWLAACGRRVVRFKEGMLHPGLILALPLALIFLAPDYGTTFLLALIAGVLLWAAGTRMSYLIVTGFAGLGAFLVAVFQNPVRLGRVMAFLHPDRHPDINYHLMQSEIAFVNGGLFGVGLGNSMQKQYYLPEAHTDFIFAIIGEEMGMLATLLVVVLFAALLVCGLMIGYKAADPFGKLLAFGLTMTLVLQALMNIGVVTGCLPTKGIALPFMSYGGSSLVMSVASIAVLVNIAYQAETADRDRRSRVVKNRLHRF